MQAIGDRVIVLPDKAEEQVNGIFIPENAQAKGQTGVVVSVGSKVTSVLIDERVLFPKYGGIEYGSYVILHEEDVLCLV
jgi:co-chaperonin GroES (HSP10)